MSARLAGPLVATVTLAALALQAATVPPPPDPGLTGSLEAADAIVEVQIIAGGPFRSAAAVRRVYRGQPARVIELSGYNSLNWDASSAAFETGSRWILFLSRTDREDVYATLTPSAPRLPVKDGRVLLSLGDPPFRLPVAEADLSAALELIAGTQEAGEDGRGVAFIRSLWARNEVEPRYLATALAGLLGEAQAVPLLAEAAGDKLLRLRLTAIESLRQIATAPALAVLRGLLQDRRNLVARQAAAALIEAQDAAAVPELLVWARRTAEAKAKLAEDDSRRIKLTQHINRLLLMLLDVGPLISPESYRDGLLDLARSPDAETATTALFALDRLAGREEIDQLLKMAEDPVYPHAREAGAALFRASLRPVLDVQVFRAWWKLNRDTFGEAMRRQRVREAAVGLALGATDILPSEHLAVLISAPAEQVLPETAHLLLGFRSRTLFEARHLNAWRGPLTLPFIMDRLASSELQERSDAMQALIVLLGRHRRLAPILMPLVRAHLADSEPLMRRLACSACGSLGDVQAFPWLLPALRGGMSYEVKEAERAVFELSARTLGYAYHELQEDNEVALRRLGAWWTKLGEDGQAAWRSPLQQQPQVGRVGREKELAKALKGGSSRASGAAFSLLFEQHSAAAPLWKELLGSKRALDRTHGVLGFFGAPADRAMDLAPILKATGERTELPRAVCFPVLSSLRGGRGADLVLDWLEGAGLKAAHSWRNLAVVSLGLAEDEPRSLAWLEKALAAGLANEVDPMAFPLETEGADEVLLPAVLLALSARADGAKPLVRALQSRSAKRRDWAARTLAFRNYTPAVSGILNVLDQGDSLTVSDLGRAVASLPQAADAERLAALLTEGQEAGRLGVALILSKRPDLAALPELRGALIRALEDTSSYVRTRAAEALGRLRARSAVPSLMTLLSDASSTPRSAALEALGLIGERGETARTASMETRLYTQVNPRWMRVLGLSDQEDDLQILLTAARSESWITRRGAFDGLGLSRRPEALAHLLGVFRETRSPYRTHAGIAMASRSQEALQALAADLESGSVSKRAAALLWLVDVPPAECGPPLIEALSDTHPGIRQLADWLLRRKTGRDAGFDYQAPAGQREERIRKWKELVGQ